MSALHIRSAVPADVPAMLEIYGPFVRSSAVTFEYEVPAPEDFEGRLARITAKHPWLVAQTEDGRIAGYAYACDHRERAAYQWCAEVSVYVAKEFRGQGVGRALYQDLFGRLRELGYVHAYAGITLPNSPSVRLHEGLGFRMIGIYQRIGYKLGAWHDVGWWELTLSPQVLTPGAVPRPPARHKG